MFSPKIWLPNLTFLAFSMRSILDKKKKKHVMFVFSTFKKAGTNISPIKADMYNVDNTVYPRHLFSLSNID